MPKRKTNSQWLREVKELVGDEYTFLSEYVNNRTKLSVIHNNCGEPYNITPKEFLAGNRCPKCNPQRLKTTDEFKDEIYELVGNEYTVESKYTGHHQPVKLKHSKCGKIYEPIASDFLKGRRCKECYFKSRMKTNQEWLDQVKLLSGDDFVFLEEYKGDSIKLEYKHFCGNFHSVTPNNFINGTRCPYCKETSGESFVRRYLTENNIDFEIKKTFEGMVYRKPLNYDFYIPSLNISVEYQGIQHYEPIPFFGGEENFKKQCIKDEIKRGYAEENNIKLIEIHYRYNTYEKVEKLLDTTITNNL